MFIKEGKFEFIALKGKGSDCEAGIYFSWRDADKIKKCEARQTRSGWILEVELRDNFELVCQGMRDFFMHRALTFT